MNPTTTIIIPSFNNKHLLMNCVESVKLYTKNYSLIIVDNNSCEDTVNYLKHLETTEQSAVIYNSDNLGFSKSINIGLNKVKTDYILFLNNDIEVTKNWLVSLIKIAEKDEKVGIVGSKLYYPGSNIIQHAGVTISYNDWNQLSPHHIYNNISENDIGKLKTVDLKAVTGACFLITKKLFNKIGPLDEEYINGYEDVDYCFRAITNGFSVVFCNESICYHYESMTPGRNTKESGLINQSRMDDKWNGKIKADRSHDLVVQELIIANYNKTIIQNLVNNDDKINFYLTKVKKEFGEEYAKRIFNTYLYYKQHYNITIKKYSLSVIIPVLNCLKYTKQIIQQLRECTYSKLEIVIIDNNSTDGTREYLESLCDDNIVCIFNGINKGYSYANNQGINKASSTYICFLNNDTMVFAGWDISLINALDSTGAAFSGPITNSSAGFQCEDYGMQKVEASNYREIAYGLSKSKKNSTRTGTFQLIGFCLLTKLSFIKKLNGFDEGFKLGNFEDMDLTLRGMLIKNFNVIAEDCFIYHFGSISFSNNKLFDQKQYDENAHYFLRKWGGEWDDKKYIPPSGFDRSKYKNTNYLIDLDNLDIISLGNYGTFQAQIDKLAPFEKIQKLKELLLIRPFNPDVLLAISDIYLQRIEYNKAAYYSSQLLKYTPQWDIAKNLNTSLIQHLNNPFVESPAKLSVCIIAKNEEQNISRCLSSVNNIADEIILVDTGSTDNTIQIASKYTDKIIKYEWTNDFAAARNKSLAEARGDWVLFLDCDEELIPGASETLIEEMSASNIIGYRLPLENVASPLHGVNYVPRLIRNAPGLHFIGKIHETIFASILVLAEQWNMEQAMGKTKILHHGYTPDEMQRKGKLKRNLALYDDALAELPDEPSIMMNYAHDLNHDGQTEKAYEIFQKIHGILEQHKSEDITPEVREQFMHNFGVFLAQEQKMEELVDVMFSRTARDTGPVANVHYMAGLGLINCRRFEESIRELELCIEKAFHDTLAPSVPDVRTWKPRHLLANANASLGNQNEAIKIWEEVLVECDDSPDPFHDYARYLSSLNRNKEAINILIKSLDSGLNGQKIWELGAGIVNSDPELAEMAMDWTEEAVQYFPESDVTNVRRGEALMKNGRYLEAIPFFERLTSRGERNATAAQLICKKMMDQLSAEDVEKVPLVQNELKGWTEIMDKAPGEFDRELAEQLIQ